MTKLKTIKELPKVNGLSTPAPLEAESPHRKLARLTADQDRLTREIREHKEAWARRNLTAQYKRQAVSNAESTAFREHHADLAAALAKVQLEIGQVNRELRGHRAKRNSKGALRNGVEKPEKKCPLKQHDAYPCYFMLAAKDVIHDEEMYKKMESAAKSMLQHALQTGVEG